MNWNYTSGYRHIHKTSNTDRSQNMKNAAQAQAALHNMGIREAKLALEQEKEKRQRENDTYKNQYTQIKAAHEFIKTKIDQKKYWEDLSPEEKMQYLHDSEDTMKLQEARKLLELQIVQEEQAVKKRERLVDITEKKELKKIKIIVLKVFLIVFGIYFIIAAIRGLFI